MRIWDKIKEVFGVDSGDDDYGYELAVPQVEVQQRQVVIPDLMRSLLHDMGFPHVEAAMEIMGYQPQSEDVSEMSERDSEQRVSELGPIFPVIGLLSDAASQAMGAYLREQLIDVEAEIDGEEVDEEMVERALSVQQNVVEASVVAVLAHLVDMGMIKVSDVEVVGIHTEDDEMEGMFDE